MAEEFKSLTTLAADRGAGGTRQLGVNARPSSDVGKHSESEIGVGGRPYATPRE
jgi:hypothetical protein